ncbi:glycosyltransferase 61 family protein [Paracoccus salsus]|uniref:glycosyltransferase 61 family protein n=1 Tax=Paracoccus salsus TaxID=2911061 RepID=UPI001F313CCE|nr:glycosyltransferase 61 family protein [Paracoccus salsus]MCF3972990.1 glycosyltransferase family 61 protein [Paracoccus salsus]
MRQRPEATSRDGTPPRPLSAWLDYLSRVAMGKVLRRGNPFTDWPPGRPAEQAGVMACRAAIIETDQLSRVVQCAFGQTLESQMAVLTATRFQEVPPHVLELGEAIIIGGVAVTPRDLFWMQPFRPSRSSLLSDLPARDRAVVPNSAPGLQFFGHWLGDDCSAHEFLRGDPDLMTTRRPRWGDAATYEILFEQRWDDAEAIRARNLTIVTDLGFSRGKRDRYHRLRRCLRDRLKAAGPAAKVIYVRRGPSAEKRDIVNQAELEATLASAGVEIVTPEGDTRQFLSRIVDADVIISIEGSQACHAIYALRDGGALLVLQPPERFFAAPHEWMRCLDLRCGMVVGEKCEGGFRIHADEVLAMTEKLLDRVAQTQP